jgi:DNA processing protein
MSVSDLTSLPNQHSYLFLAATPSIGYHTLKKMSERLVQYRLSWSEFLASGEGTWRKCGLKSAQIDELKTFAKRFSPQTYFEYLESHHIQTVFIDDPRYPALLKEIPDKPLCLFALGDLEVLSTQKIAVAVVGTRKMTEYGRFVTTKIAEELCDLDVTVVSGLMYGVDLTAHQVAIQQAGQTIGILGYGFTYLSHAAYLDPRWLKEFSVQKGLLLSEYPPDTSPEKGTFLQRNRLIAGMTNATVVTEAAQKSGSLHTASCAIEYNRLVCAVPGSIRSPFSKGTQDLLNMGAILVDSGYEIMKELGGSVEAYSRKNEEGAAEVSILSSISPTGNQIYQLIIQDQLSTDQLSQKLHLSVSDIHTELTELEIFGYIKKVGPRWAVAALQ